MNDKVTPKPTYLTKSRFKIARECPTKLYYSLKKDVYQNNKLDDPFLEALAEGGCQVGELAKYYYPGGHDIVELNHQIALEKTAELLKQDEVIIYEAAIKAGGLFIRADILVKKGNRIRIVEVKAKSCSGKNPDQFKAKKKPIDSGWAEYLEDIAFQKYVVKQAFPDSIVTCSLMLADKTSVAPTSGLNQKFRIVRDSDRFKGVTVSSDLNDKDLADPILTEIPVDDLVEQIWEGATMAEDSEKGFIGNIRELENASLEQIKLPGKLGTQCKHCEFRCKGNSLKQGMKSGFDECWKEKANLSDEALKQPLSLDVWYPKTKAFLESSTYLMSALTEEQIAPKDDGKIGLSRSERQWLQVKKYQNKDNSVYVNQEDLRAEMESWTYPLHFIDFETSATAIPFFKGMAPYEQTAFQYSHHIVHADGRIEHKGEFLQTEPGSFPNYEFVRALKAELEQDQGTIFRFHNHENTILCAIYRQLQKDPDAPADAESLCAFIQEIARPTKSSGNEWEEGERCMVDLQQLIVKFYYDPETGGSNSIKQVLPAILKRSQFLQSKYAQPIYGSTEYPSHNFNQHVWLERKDGEIQDPYKTLKPLFEGIDTDDLEIFSQSSDVADGGAALTAYNALQFVEMSQAERDELNSALLRYCELDTLAMVMIFEEWNQLLNPDNGPKKDKFVGTQTQTTSQNINQNINQNEATNMVTDMAPNMVPNMVPDMAGDNKREEQNELHNTNMQTSIINAGNQLSLSTNQRQPRVTKNILKAMSHGDGNIGETNISSLLENLINPVFEHDCCDELLHGLIALITREHPPIKSKLIDEGGNPLWSHMETTLELKVSDQKRKLGKPKSRDLDLVIEFWSQGNEYRTNPNKPDVVFAIENKLNDGAVSDKHQLIDELFGIQKHYRAHAANPEIIFVFLGPVDSPKSKAAFRLLKEKSAEDPLLLAQVRWQGEHSVASILSLIRQSDSYHPETRYIIDCLLDFIDIGFSLKTERANMLLNLAYKVLESQEKIIWDDEQIDRYSLKYDNSDKRFAAVFTQRSRGEFEFNHYQKEEAIPRFQRRAQELNIDHLITIEPHRTDMSYIWLTVDIRKYERVIVDEAFVQLFTEMLMESYELYSRPRQRTASSTQPRRQSTRNGTNFETLEALIESGQVLSDIQLKFMRLWDNICRGFLPERSYYFVLHGSRINVEGKLFNDNFIAQHIKTRRGRIEMLAEDNLALIDDVELKLEEWGMGDAFVVESNEKIYNRYWIKPTDSFDVKLLEDDKLINLLTDLVKASWAYREQS